MQKAWAGRRGQARGLTSAVAVGGDAPTRVHWPEQGQPCVAPTFSTRPYFSSVVFIGLNKANLAWLAWSEGNFSEAQALGQAALAEWQSLKVVDYYLQWTALLPLIAVALVQDRLTEAVVYARGLLAPEQ